MVNGQKVIAIEEHFATPEYIDAVDRWPITPGDEEEMDMMRGLVTKGGAVHDSLLDMDSRIAEMDAAGTDVAVLSLNSPGVQAFETETAKSLVSSTNDALEQIVRDRPDRFAGFGAIAPQAPEWSAEEIARIMGPLGLSGVMLCSHTGGHYLDEPQFDPVLAALEETGATLYIHPRYPSAQMLQPYAKYGMAGAVWGYQAETGTHAVRMIMSGVFDRYPNLKLVLGHLGEGLPFWKTRLDNRYKWMYGAAGESLGMVKLELTPSEYLKRNVFVTTSGMADPEALDFCLQRLGEDNVLFAIDTPYEPSDRACEFLRDLDLTDSQRAKISHENAEALLRLPA